MRKIMCVAWMALTEFYRQIPGVLLTYLAPVVMMSIFGLIFGGFGKPSDGNAVELLIVDEDQSTASQALVSELSSLEALEVYTAEEAEAELNDGKAIDAARAEQLVREGTFGNTLIIPEGFAEVAGNVMYQGDYQIVLMSDSSMQIDQAIANGMVQKSMFTVLGKVQAQDGVEQMGKRFGLAPNVVSEMQQWLDTSMGMSKSGGGGGGEDSGDGAAWGIGIENRDLLGEDRENPMLSHQVAAWLTIFILFTMTASGGSLLRERASGTLRRVLQSPVKPLVFLTGKYIAFVAIAFSQVLTMYLAGWLILRVDIIAVLGQLLFFGLLTAMAATGFGLVLAVICRTPEELSGASTIVILAMGALGGSMFPSFLMPETIQFIGKLTFNGWAMQGYQDIFWRGQGFGGIMLESGVMLLIAVVTMAVATALFNQRFVKAR